MTIRRHDRQRPVAEGAPPAKKPPMGRVAVATTVGTTIEYYDFFIYGTAAALVFPTVFFAALGESAALVASFATFAVAFFARPVGAVVFGHFGDRIGRKKALVATLLIMGSATVLIGLLPTPESLGAFGVVAPILLVTLRFLQGFAVGGEWAGAALMAAEYAPPKLRGYFAALPMLGPAIAFGLASGTFLVTNITLGDSSTAFVEVGWRVPFILSAALVVVGLWIRLSIEETPVFLEAKAAAEARAEAERAVAAAAGTALAEPGRRTLPIWEAVRRQWREMVLGGLAFSSLFAFFYLGTSFLTSYGSKVLQLERNEILTAGLVTSVFFALATVGSGMLSDRIGRRGTLLVAGVAGLGWSFVMFPVLDMGLTEDGGSVVSFTLGVSGTLVVAGLSFGAAGSFLPELFETRYRYTGAGLAYSLAGILGGALPPLAAAGLLAAFGGGAVGLMLTGIALVSVLVLALLRETRGADLADAGPAAAAPGAAPAPAPAAIRDAVEAP
ncbi:MFS transporter [Citricoccus sp. SGAir0253]|uniref:MFS transporter n=1 Tax=Citricoccus sp. SGAir0253 TaxID=2567881 RepID=UPI0010CCBFD9|nr:MFS transporter [Citricoccus sp. SGAir0253]QCU79081.1 MFS transporter [Citricoccus sp. SGAir0253]